MKKNIKKFIAVLSAAAMVAAGTTYTPMMVSADNEYSSLAFKTLITSGGATLQYAYVSNDIVGLGDPWYGDGGITLQFAFADASEKAVVYINDTETSGGVVTYASTNLVKINPTLLENNAYTTIKISVGTTSAEIVVLKGNAGGGETSEGETTSMNISAPVMSSNPLIQLNDFGAGNIIYVAGLDTITNAISYNLYVDGVLFGEVTNGQNIPVSKFAGGSHLFQVTGVNPGGESEKSQGYTITIPGGSEEESNPEESTKENETSSEEITTENETANVDVDWSTKDFLGNGSGNAAYDGVYKAVANNSKVMIVNIQTSPKGEAAIYVTFPVAIASSSIANGEIQGAGLFIPVVDCSAAQTNVVVTTADGSKYTVSIFNANAEEVTTKEAETSAEVTTKEAETPAEVTTKEVETSAEVTTKEAETSAEVTTKEAETSAEVTTKEVETYETTTGSAIKEQQIKKSQVKISTANKKKVAKKLKVTLVKKISGASGYSVRVYTSKSKAKANKSILVKATTNKNLKTFVISSGKLKNKKLLYVRVRAYANINGRKIYSNKWSNILKVKIK